MLIDFQSNLTVENMNFRSSDLCKDARQIIWSLSRSQPADRTRKKETANGKIKHAPLIDEN